jgi:hypothetical protein
MLAVYNGDRPEETRYTLMTLYRKAFKQASDAAHDSGEDVDNIWSRISPSGGNIYRLNSLEAEHLKHRYDLKCQVAELAEQKQVLLNKALSAKNTPPSSEAREELLTQLLIDAKPRGFVLDEEGGDKVDDLGFLPLREFLGGGGVASYWYLGGMLLPTRKSSFRRMLKNRLLGLLIACIQISGPIMIFIRNWYMPTNYLRLGISKYFSWREVTCFGNASDASTALLGTMFLYIVYEVSRGYALTEIESATASRCLPNDHFWQSLGRIANQLAIVFTCLAMPLVFWSELAPKDIVFDSLAMLFIFSLDDLSGGALDYLNLSDSDFCKMRSWFTVFLGQTPVDLNDVVNPQAEVAEEIWQVLFDNNGLVNTRTGKPCETRLREDTRKALPMSETTPLAAVEDQSSSPFKFDRFQYTVARNDGPDPLPGSTAGIFSFLRHMWWFIFIGLGALELVVPPVFMVVNDPCYSD